MTKAPVTQQVHFPVRRRASALLIASAAALALAACGQGSDPADPAAGQDEADQNGGEQITLRYSWWGSDTRHQMNKEVIEAFMADNPDIKVIGDFTDWAGYWDKLATQTAGGDAPDVITMDANYLRAYADRGVLADLADTDVATSDIDSSILDGGIVEDALVGIPTGVNATAMLVDTQIFDEAGVELPDDATWTWQDYVDVMGEVAANSPEGVYGAQDFGVLDQDIAIRARQVGQQLWTPEGGIGVEADVLADLWQVSLDLHANGASPDVSQSLEIHALGPEQSLVGTNKGAVARYWTNQLGTLADASGRDLQLWRYPGETEFERTGIYLKPAMLLSMSATTDHPDAAARFIDYLLNSEEVGKIILTDRGLPANSQVREAIIDDLNDADRVAAEFIEKVTPEIVDAMPVAPSETGDVLNILARYNEQVLFGQLDPLEGAEAFIDEANSVLNK